MNIEDLLRETDTEPPCGPDLEYDHQFLALATAAEVKPEQQYGATVIPAEEPDWRSLVEQATQLLGRTKDLRVAVLLTRGLTRTTGLQGLADGAQVIRRLVERHWDEVHPRLAVDGVVDPYLRGNALAALADADGLIRDIRGATLLRTKQAGPISVRAAEASLKREATAGITMSEAQLKQAVAEELPKDDAPIHAVPVALEHFRAVAALAEERLGPVDAPNLDRLLQKPAKRRDGVAELGEGTGLLATIEVLLPTNANTGNGATGNGAPKVETSIAASEVPGVSLGNGELHSREEALKALERVCRYLERTEPSNPAPLLIRRAQRLIGSGFLDIMRDMAPDSLGHIELILGQRGAAAKDAEAQ